MASVEFEFIKNKSRFKCLHFSDQMSLMIHYLREGKLPFDKMSENQRKDFRRMARITGMMTKRTSCLESLQLEEDRTNEANMGNYISTDIRI